MLDKMLLKQQQELLKTLEQKLENINKGREKLRSEIAALEKCIEELKKSIAEHRERAEALRQEAAVLREEAAQLRHEARDIIETGFAQAKTVDLGQVPLTWSPTALADFAAQGQAAPPHFSPDYQKFITQIKQRILTEVDGGAESIPSLDLEKAAENNFKEQLAELCKGISVKHVDKTIQTVSEMQEVVAIGKEVVAQLIANIEQKADQKLHDAKQKSTGAEQKGNEAKQEDGVADKKGVELRTNEKSKMEKNDRVGVLGIQANALEKQIGVVEKEDLGVQNASRSVYQSRIERRQRGRGPQQFSTTNVSNSEQDAQKQEDNPSSYRPK